MKNRAWMVVVIGVIGIVCGAGTLPAQNGELREFVSTGGQAMQAKLISHKKGKVTLERGDGKQFEVDPALFRVEDQVFIKEWMQANPEKITYLFGITADKIKVDGGMNDLGYKRVKNERWAYRIKITNRSSDTVRGLTVLYRLFHTNRADGEFSAGSDASPAEMTEGQAALPGELVYNRTLEVTTVPVQLDYVDYDGSGFRYKDELQGCLVRIVDEKGSVVAEWANQASPMKGRTWENTGSSARSGSVIVR